MHFTREQAQNSLKHIWSGVWANAAGCLCCSVVATLQNLIKFKDANKARIHQSLIDGEFGNPRVR